MPPRLAFSLRSAAVGASDAAISSGLTASSGRCRRRSRSSPGGVERIVVEVEAIDQRERRGGAVALAHGDGSVQRYDRAGLSAPNYDLGR